MNMTVWNPETAAKAANGVLKINATQYANSAPTIPYRIITTHCRSIDDISWGKKI
jgi:hypothetical protein